MASLILDKCCFCINLRLGCLIFAYLKLIAVGLTAMTLLFLFTGGIVLYVNGKLGKGGHTEFIYDEIMIGVAGILFLLAIITLAFVITLIVGLHQTRRGHVKAYLIYTTTTLIIHFIAFPVYTRSYEFGNLTVILHPIVFILQLYVLVVIRSYYNSMKYSNELSKEKEIDI